MGVEPSPDDIMKETKAIKFAGRLWSADNVPREKLVTSKMRPGDDPCTPSSNQAIDHANKHKLMRLFRAFLYRYILCAIDKERRGQETDNIRKDNDLRAFPWSDISGTH